MRNIRVRVACDVAPGVVSAGEGVVAVSEPPAVTVAYDPPSARRGGLSTVTVNATSPDSRPMRADTGHVGGPVPFQFQLAADGAGVQVVVSDDMGSSTQVQASVPIRSGVMAGFAAPTVKDITDMEAQLGTRFEVHRTYVQDPAKPWVDGAKEKDDAASGRITHLSFKLPWLEVTAGKHDELLQKQAQLIAASGRAWYLSYFHEPDTGPNKEQGKPADFCAAWRHVVDIFRAAGCTNVKWVLTLMAYTYGTKGVDAWYPGDGYVDLLGGDGYNWANTPRQSAWTRMSKVGAGLYAYGQKRGLPICFPEFGCAEDPKDPTARAVWLTDAWSTFTKWGVVYAVYFNTTMDGCEWTVKPGQPALASLRTIANLA